MTDSLYRHVGFAAVFWAWTRRFPRSVCNASPSFSSPISPAFAAHACLSEDEHSQRQEEFKGNTVIGGAAGQQAVKLPRTACSAAERDLHSAETMEFGIVFFPCREHCPSQALWFLRKPEDLLQDLA